MYKDSHRFINKIFLSWHHVHSDRLLYPLNRITLTTYDWIGDTKQSKLSPYRHISVVNVDLPWAHGTCGRRTLLLLLLLLWVFGQRIDNKRGSGWSGAKRSTKVLHSFIHSINNYFFYYYEYSTPRHFIHPFMQSFSALCVTAFVYFSIVCDLLVLAVYTLYIVLRAGPRVCTAVCTRVPEARQWTLDQAQDKSWSRGETSNPRRKNICGIFCLLRQ